jgi:hypothetical protein
MLFDELHNGGASGSEIASEGEESNLDEEGLHDRLGDELEESSEHERTKQLENESDGEEGAYVDDFV